MKLFPSLLLFFVLAFTSVKAQNFVPDDVLVSAYDSRICDIEIDPYGKRICWQSYLESDLWVCHLDTITWGLTVPNGKEIFVDDELTNIEYSNNSAEWGYDVNGTYLFYSTVNDRKRYITIAWDSTTTWATTTLMDCPNRMNPHATKNPGDEFAAFHYMSMIWPTFTKYKFINDLYTEHWVSGFVQASWAQGERTLIGVKNNCQVAIYIPGNLDPPVQITEEYDVDYSRPFMWRAPEHDSSRMFFAIADGEEVRIYKDPDNFSGMTKGFHFYTSFTSPSSNPEYIKIGSAEPFVYEGHSYITFMVSSSEFENAGVPSEIWIAKIDSVNTEFRRISDVSLAVRTDPEAFATNDSLIVYYTEVDTTVTPSYFRIRKCRTGYGKETVTSVPQTEAEKQILYPNPFSVRINLLNNSGEEEYVLYDQTGRVLWDGKRIEKQDFSFIDPGVYFLRITLSGHNSQVFSIVKKPGDL